MKKPYDVIKIDKYTKKIQTPTLLLMTRSFDVIGKIPHFTNWNISLVGNGVDEISFTVHKYVNGDKCPVWEDLIDLKIIDVRGFGRFEISVDYTDNTETAKSVHGQSLEVELAQIPLYEFHVNDDDATTMEITDYNANDFDENGSFKPTVFYNPTDELHSLLHRVLADKAPHWSIGYVTPCIALDEESQPEPSSEFQRTYTCDGTTIYDFLTGEVAEESNVIFTFDTINREINCYNLCDCIDQNTGEILAKGIGEDTNILVSKRKLANEITISSDKDNVKNCFRIEGGDDIITDMVRVVNMNGSNYIYQFADFQYNDMPKELVNKLEEYQEAISSQDAQDEYYGENGIYTRLCEKYDELEYFQSSMMPEVVISETTAKEQYKIMVDGLTDISTTVGVSSFENYDNNLFIGVSNNVEAMANVLIDARYKAKVIEGSASYDSASHTWTGNIQITRAADDTDYYPKNNTEAYQNRFTINISDDELTFIRQKIEKALAKGSMLDIDFDIAGMNDDEIREYFSLYSLNRLKSFYDGYNSCLSILMAMPSDSTVRKDMYDKYFHITQIISNPPTKENPNPIPGVLDIRQAQVKSLNVEIENITKEQQAFPDKYNLNLQKFLGDDLYKIFCSYRREDTYKNDNYISDGLSTSECLAKAKKLVEVAAKEAKKACVLQRTVSTSLNNLFALPEFELFYDKFALFNYIRIRTEDEILKLRLIGVNFNGESVSDINVTFSEQIESVDGTMSDLQSIIQQASGMATSFPSTALQAKKGAEAQSTVSDMFNNGLNAAKTMLASSDDQDVTITKSGIICRRKEDEGYYSNNQLRITNNVIGFTRDGWKTVSEAIGEILYTDPITGEKSMKYGVIAEAIIGQLIAGENMYIGNKNGSVQITGDGIDITNGALCISDNNYSIEIDPKHQLGNYTLSNYLFCIREKLNDNVIMSVDTMGNAYFSGKIETSNGKIGRWIIGEALYNGTDSLSSTTNGTYIGTDGIRQYSNEKYVQIQDGKLISNNIELIGGSINIGNNFAVDPSGNIVSNGNINIGNGKLVYASNTLTVEGNINAVGGTFSGAITSTATISGGTISGGTISGGSISIGSNFSVDTSGNMIATNATITGTINANLGAIGNWKILPNRIEIDNTVDNDGDGEADVGYRCGIQALSSPNSSVFYAGCSTSAGKEIADYKKTNFYVTQSGNLYARNATIMNSLYMYDDVNNNRGKILSFEYNAIHFSSEYELWSYSYIVSKKGFNASDCAYKLSNTTHNVNYTALGIYTTSDKNPATYVGNKDYRLRLRGNSITAQVAITVDSDKNIKNSFKSLDDLDDVYMCLEPLEFKYNSDKSNTSHFGFAAQDVIEAFRINGYENEKYNGIVHTSDSDADNNIPILGIAYSEFISWNTHMIQKAYKKIEEQQKQIEAMQLELNRLKELIS